MRLLAVQPERRRHVVPSGTLSSYTPRLGTGSEIPLRWEEPSSLLQNSPFVIHAHVCLESTNTLPSFDVKGVNDTLALGDYYLLHFDDQVFEGIRGVRT